MKKMLLYGFAATAAGATLAAGCGSGNRTIAVPSPTPTPVATPTPTGTATPTPSPVASSRAGDFAFAPSEIGISSEYYAARALNADGTGSRTALLQSVNGFSAPVTFVSSVTAINDVNFSTIDPGAVSVAFSPASLASLPAGTTPVTVSVAMKAASTLPPLTRVKVSLYAQGGGLKRYLSGDGTPASSDYFDDAAYFFVTPGFAFTISTSGNSFSGAIGSTFKAYANIETFGLTGTASFAVTGAPTGLTATFDTPTLAITPNPPLDSAGENNPPILHITFTANQNIPAGTYPVHFTATLNGTTYTSDALYITVSPVAFN